MSRRYTKREDWTQRNPYSQPIINICASEGGVVNVYIDGQVAHQFYREPEWDDRLSQY